MWVLGRKMGVGWLGCRVWVKWASEKLRKSEKKCEKVRKNARFLSKKW